MLFRISLFALTSLFALSPLAGAPARHDDVLVVMAESATQPAMNDAIAAFSAAHPSVHVSAEYLGSDEIGGRLTAPAAAPDVVLLADGAVKTAAGRLSDVRAALRDRTTLVVNAHAAAAIRDAADLVRPDVRLGAGAGGSDLEALGDHTVDRLARTAPDFAARYARNIALVQGDRARGWLARAVADGTLDAAIMFRSDVVPGASVEVPLPDGVAVAEVDDVAIRRDTQRPELARAFAALLTSPQGAAIFRAHGHDPIP